MQRSTISFWIQCCPRCDYCATAINEKTEINPEVLNSTEYKDILDKSELPELAKFFIASSFLNEKLNKNVEVAWDAMSAAWICDNENDHDHELE